MAEQHKSDAETAAAIAGVSKEMTTTRESSPAKPELEIPPEEGRDGWLCLLGAFFCLFCSFGFLNAIGVFQTTYENTTLSEYSPSEISWIFAVQLFLMWAPGPVFGRVIDTFGPRQVLYPSALLCVFSLCMTSLCDQYYQIFLAQGLGFGIGAGGVFTSALIAVGQWFVKRRGLATGIATVGSSLGGIIFPIFFPRVMDQVGFNGAVRYTALLMGILLLSSCVLVKGRLPVKKWDWKLKWFDFSLFREKEFAIFTIGMFIAMWGLWAPFNYLPSMAIANGFSTTMGLYLISLVNATSVPGRLLPPYLADKIGHFNVLTLCCFGCGASIITLWLPFNYHPSHAGIIVFALVYGFFSGAVVSLVLPCVAKTGPIQTIGVRFGTFQLVVAVALLTGLPIMGAILNEQNGEFSGLQIFGGVTLTAGSILSGVATYFIGNIRNTRKM